MAESWVRLWAGMTTDPKWQTIARKSGQPRALVIALFAHLMLEANEATVRGSVSEVNVEDVASALDCDEEAVQAILQAMQGRTIEGDMLSGWDRRQPKREDSGNERTGSMSSTERSRLHRERKRSKGDDSSGDETQGNARNDDATQSNAPEAEAEADTEERIGGPAATTPPCVREEAPNAAPDPEHSGSADRPTPDATPNRAAQLSVLLRRNGADPRTKPNDRHLADWVAAGVTDSQVLQALDTAKARRAAASSTQPIGTPYLTPIIAELRSPGGGKPSGAKTPAQRRSDWTQELNQTLAHLTGDTSSEPEFHDLGDFDATGHPI